MRGLFDHTPPSFQRMLLIESGSREIGEKLLTQLYELQQQHGQDREGRLDLLTCFAQAPQNFDRQRGSLLRVTEPRIACRKLSFVRELVSARYHTVAIICDGEGILQKWKWAIGVLSPSKILLCSTPSACFFLDAKHAWAARSRYAMRFRRPDLSWVRRIAELSVAPFSVLFLAMYAASSHLKRIFSKVY